MNLIQFEFISFLFLLGFVFTFLIGWLRSRGRTSFLVLAARAALIGAALAVLLCGAFSAVFFYMMRDVKNEHFQPPLTVEEARHLNCPIVLPDSAQNVQFEIVSGGIQAVEILVRFEAPVDVCKSHVQTVFNAMAGHTGRPLLVPLDHTPLPEDHDMVGRAPWFDVEKIRFGCEAQSNNTQFWIDMDRGIFYCKITD
jgi:hypothetical protein